METKISFTLEIPKTLKNKVLDISTDRKKANEAFASMKDVMVEATEIGLLIMADAKAYAIAKEKLEKSKKMVEA